MNTFLTITAILFWWAASAQSGKTSVVIGSKTTRPNALLIVNPQQSDQGVLLPQLSTGQRMSMKPSSPSEDGLIVFDSNLKSYFYWSDGGWVMFRPDYRKPRFASIDPANFQQLKTDNNIRHENMAIFETDNTFVTASRNGVGEEIVAPVNLPHGSVMKELAVYYMDNDDDNIRVMLMRKSLSGGSEEILSWQSTGMSPAVNNVTLAYFNGKEKIDLENYTYRLIVVFDLDDGEEVTIPADATQRLYGVRIKYEE